MEQYKNTLDYINKFVYVKPKMGLVLGSGLGDVANDIDIITKDAQNIGNADYTELGDDDDEDDYDDDSW
jgi:purine nucleoside phosphorylase